MLLKRFGKTLYYLFFVNLLCIKKKKKLESMKKCCVALHAVMYCYFYRFPKGTLLRSWLTKSRPRLLLLIAGLKRPQVTLMRRKRMKRTKVAKAT